jgi:EmrB/QacA subfamily drug resistance transporter
MMLGALDASIMSTVLPQVTADLGGLAQLSWVTTMYLLATTATVPLWGKAGDLLGHRRMLQAATVVFLAGSAGAGLASSMGMLIAARGVQGAGAGGLMVLVMSVLAQLVPPRFRGRYTAWFSAVAGAAALLGALAGGLLTQLLSWRWAFYVNLPLGAVAMLVVGRRIPAGRRRQGPVVVDWPGALLLLPAVCPLLLALEWAGPGGFGWSSPRVLLALGGAVLFGAGFLVWERRAPEPLVPPALFSSRSVNVASGIAFLTEFVIFGVAVLMPLVLQVTQGLSPTAAGLALLPLTLGKVAASVLVGRYTARTGRYRLLPLAGGVVVTGAVALLAWFGPSASYLLVGALLLLFGAGLAGLTQVPLLVVQSAAPPGLLGAAGSTLSFVRSVGAALGAAVVGSVFTAALSAGLPAAAGEPGSALGVLPGLPPGQRQAVVDVFARALGDGLLVTVGCAVAVVALAAMLPGRTLSAVSASDR